MPHAAKFESRPPKSCKMHSVSVIGGSNGCLVQFIAYDCHIEDSDELHWRRNLNINYQSDMEEINEVLLRYLSRTDSLGNWYHCDYDTVIGLINKVIDAESRITVFQSEIVKAHMEIKTFLFCLKRLSVKPLVYNYLRSEWFLRGVFKLISVVNIDKLFDFFTHYRDLRMVKGVYYSTTPSSPWIGMDRIRAYAHGFDEGPGVIINVGEQELMYSLHSKCELCPAPHFCTWEATMSPHMIKFEFTGKIMFTHKDPVKNLL